MSKPKAISDRTWQGQQSWNREVIESIDKSKVRMTVKVDAYDFQSYAKAELWKESGWVQVHKIPGQQLRTMKLISYVARDVRPAAFQGDIDELRRVAMEVIS